MRHSKNEARVERDDARSNFKVQVAALARQLARQHSGLVTQAELVAEARVRVLRGERAAS